MNEVLSAQRKAQTLIRLVDDDESVLRALTVFLSMNGWQTRCYSSARKFLEDDDFTKPGCVVLDVRMPIMSGIEAQREMQRRGIELPIIFLSAHGDIEMAVEAVHKGARTFLVKPPKPEQFLAEIAHAAAADFERRRNEAYAVSLQTQWTQLTPAEQRVAVMVGKGLTNAVIAEAIGVAERTVRSQRASIYEKLEIENAVELADFLHEMQATLPLVSRKE